MSNTENVLGWYATVLNGWQVKALGPKPTAELFTQAHALGCRPGKQALAMAMYLREGGATDGQVKMACIIQWGSSGSHHNKRRDLIGAKFVKAKPVVSDAQGHKVYAIALTATGTAKVAKPVDVVKVAKPVKAKAAKPAKTDKPVIPATVTEPLAGLAADLQQTQAAQ